MKVRKISRRTFLIGGCLAFASYLYFDVKSIAVTKYTVPIRNLPSSFEGFTILQLSDLHSKVYGEGQENLLSLIYKLDFDLVAITGDMVDKNNPDIKPALDLVKGLPNRPIFFVPGNHDWWTNYEIKQPLISEGVKILENSNCKYSNNGEYIWIIGVDDPYLDKDEMDLALKNINNSSPKLLLAHAPNIYDKAVQSNIDLVMVGHTHGGQVRFPFLGAIIVPGQGIFPKLDYGSYSSGTTTMVINGGLGESILPLRFYNRPEVVLITLEKMG